MIGLSSPVAQTKRVHQIPPVALQQSVSYVNRHRFSRCFL
jgi:hypothetical protein